MSDTDKRSLSLDDVETSYTSSYEQWKQQIRDETAQHHAHDRHALISAYVICHFDIGPKHSLYKDEMKKQIIQDRLNQIVRDAVPMVLGELGYKQVDSI